MTVLQNGLSVCNASSHTLAVASFLNLYRLGHLEAKNGTALYLNNVRTSQDIIDMSRRAPLNFLGKNIHFGRH